MSILRKDTAPTKPGPAEWFTGQVKMQNIRAAEAPARAHMALVQFEAGARTAWHTHPLGQTIIVLEGSGLVQIWGEPIQEISEGDVVWFPPDVKHWHGAAPSSSMSHYAVHEALDGKTVDWLEHVSDAQYRA